MKSTAANMCMSPFMCCTFGESRMTRLFLHAATRNTAPIRKQRTEIRIARRSATASHLYALRTFHGGVLETCLAIWPRIPQARRVPPVVSHDARCPQQYQPTLASRTEVNGRYGTTRANSPGRNAHLELPARTIACGTKILSIADRGQTRRQPKCSPHE